MVAVVVAVVVSVDSVAAHWHVGGRADSHRPRSATSWHTPTEPSGVVHAAPQSQLALINVLPLAVAVDSVATHSHKRTDNSRPRPGASSHTPAEPSAVVHEAPQSQLSLLTELLVLAAGAVTAAVPARQATRNNDTARHMRVILFRRVRQARMLS